eukprot:13528993-Alexandrium_andersonii.AAC.1
MVGLAVNRRVTPVTSARATAAALWRDVARWPAHAHPVPGGRLPELVGELAALVWRPLETAPHPNPATGPE